MCVCGHRNDIARPLCGKNGCKTKREDALADLGGTVIVEGTGDATGAKLGPPDVSATLARARMIHAARVKVATAKKEVEELARKAEAKKKLAEKWADKAARIQQELLDVEQESGDAQAVLATCESDLSDAEAAEIPAGGGESDPPKEGDAQPATRKKRSDNLTLAQQNQMLLERAQYESRIEQAIQASIIEPAIARANARAVADDHDPVDAPRDGHCQMWSVADQLSQQGEATTAADERERLVAFLAAPENRKRLVGGGPDDPARCALESVVGTTRQYDAWLERLRGAEWGDYLTLTAFATIHQRRIRVWSDEWEQPKVFRPLWGTGQKKAARGRPMGLIYYGWGHYGSSRRRPPPAERAEAAAAEAEAQRRIAGAPAASMTSLECRAALVSLGVLTEGEATDDAAHGPALPAERAEHL
eukprot:gene2615-2029_t